MNKQEKVKKSLFYSILDGSAWSFMYGFGEKYISAFAVFLKVTNIQLGLLTSLPLLLGSLFQIFSVKLIEMFKTRKKIVLTFALIQAFCWLLIISVFFLGKFKMVYLIFFACIYWIVGMINGPAWNSWMGDLVNENERGKYFAKRNKIIGVFILISTIIAGIILDLFKKWENLYFGFAIIFCIAFLSRLLSSLFLSKQYEPKITQEKEEEKFTFFDYLKGTWSRNHGIFILFLAMLNFAVYISAPFFAAYMLYDLKFSYLQYMIILALPFVIRFFTFPIWGIISDKYGNVVVLRVTSSLIPAVPVLWIFSMNFYYLILIESFSAIIWSGFELSTFDFFFDTTSTQKRARCVSYYNVLNGIMIFLGAMLGSLIVRYNHVFWTKYYLVFLVSGIVRYLIIIIFTPRIKEVRNIEKIEDGQVFSKSAMILLSEFRGAISMISKPFKSK